MNYVYVKYPRPEGQRYPSFGVLHADNIDTTKFQLSGTQQNGIDQYCKGQS
jgi:hypothetical protein